MIKKKCKRALIIGLIIAVLGYLYFNTSRILYYKGCSEFEANISTAVYEAIGKQLVEKQSFENLFSIERDSLGNILLISTDSFRLNYLSAALATKTAEIYSNYADGGVEVPLGVFSGLTILSGLGSTVRLKLISVISVKCEFYSEFVEAGINVTKQTLTLLVTPDVRIVTNGGVRYKSEQISVLVYENIIIGKVPELYLNSRLVGDNG